MTVLVSILRAAKHFLRSGKSSSRSHMSVTDGEKLLIAQPQARLATPEHIPLLKLPS